MIDMNCLRYRLGNAFRPVVTLTAGALMLCALPAGAGWLDRGIGVAGAGKSVKETLDENTGILGKMFDAVMDDDEEALSGLMEEVAKTPGKLIKRTFPALEAPQAVADRLKSAKQKIERFAGGVREGLADARAALATDGEDRNGGWSDASLLKDPLPAPPDTAFAASGLAPRPASPAALAGKPGQGAGSADNPADPAWDFEQWVIAKQEAHPHCYGVVDPETLPPECFGEAGAASPAAGKVADSPRAAGDWTVEDDGWSGWDKSDPRYSDADREAARVGVFAADCWGVYGVSKRHGLYELMRARMQRNECPNEETDPASSDDAGNEYAAALADVLEDGSTDPAADDYLSALNDLEAKEAARLRLEEEARQRQARLEAEERERRARLEAEEERERQAQLAQQREFNRQAAQQLGQALGGLIRAYSGDGASDGGGTTKRDDQPRGQWINCTYYDSEGNVAGHCNR